MNNYRNLRTAFAAAIVAIIYTSCGGPADKKGSVSNTAKHDRIAKSIPADTIPNHAEKIIAAYPDFEITYKENTLIFPDGTKIVCDDGKEKTFTEKLDDCDIEDMFSMKYDTTSSRPKYLSDCGRGRNEQLFKKMYGDSEAAVRRNLVKVRWFGGEVPFTKINGAAKQLGKVAAELAEMPHLKKYLTNATSFYWRKVRGANRQSAHSYGIAIDINTSYSNYWLWANPGSTETTEISYENRIPLEIVKVFEKYGFIWGGRWYHYDTMHFEYRPEFSATAH